MWKVIGLGLGSECYSKCYESPLKYYHQGSDALLGLK